MSSVANVRLLSCSLLVMFVTAVGCQEAPAPEGVASNEPSATVATPESIDATPNDQGSPAEGMPAETPEESDSTELAAVTPSATEPPTVPATPETPEEEPAVELLGIGDPAPPLAISQWMKGEPVEALESGEVYVVEFWATWCGPCLAGMPHISALQTEYGDTVRIIGVTREEADIVEGFLGEEQSEGKTWNDVITYRLAIDQDDATNNAYMRAAGQNGIPTAFIVGRDGAIEWIGHPMTIDEPLAKVVAGDWDRAAAIAELEKQQKLQELQIELSRMVRSQDWDGALALLDQAEEAAGPSAGLTQTRLAVLQRAGRMEEFAALQEQLVKDSWEDSQMLNEIAWSIAIGRGERDLDLALRTAERAAELTSHEDASVLDTLARVYYEQGKLAEAVEWQKKAAEHDAGNPQITATLEQYEAELAEKPATTEPPAETPESTPEEGATPSTTEEPAETP